LIMGFLLDTPACRGKNPMINGVGGVPAALSGDRAGWCRSAAHVSMVG
jgi:hypothetical protein